MRVYFIGAGPGDPGLLTLRGAQALAACHAVFAPMPYEVSFAEFLAGKKLLVPFDFNFAGLLEATESLLQEGAVGFLVPGDLTFFSPFQPLISALGDRAEVIPGVGSVNLAAARLKRTLNPATVCNRSIIASPRVMAETADAPPLRELAAPGTTLVLYMNHLPLPDLAAELRAGYGQNVPIALFHRLGLSGEKIICGTLEDIAEKAVGFDLFPPANGSQGSSLTLTIVGEALRATMDSSWWDNRLEQVWKHRTEKNPEPEKPQQGQSS